MKDLNPLPRSFGTSPPSPLLERGRRQQHGRQYSVQLKHDEQPEGQEDYIRSRDIAREVRAARESKELPRLPIEDTEQSQCPAVTVTDESDSWSSKSRALDHLEIPSNRATVEEEQLSPEELFARKFGYSLSPSQTPVSPSAPPIFLDEQVVQVTLPTTQRTRRRSARPRLRPPLVDGEEGNLIGLPPPPLLRPSAFWRNTWRSALHIPSFHLVRRSTFIAAGLTLEQPVCDLSAFAVESRITIGKTRGLGGSAAVPVDITVFG